MPSSMIHLLTARDYAENADVLFYIGCLAPDCIEERTFKDHNHFRDRSDRVEALSEFRDSLDLSKPFDMGVIIHLYTDMKWDETTRGDFHKYFFDENGFEFLKYRGEISVASRYLYHHTEWSEKIWDEMNDFSVEKYPNTGIFPKQEIHTFVEKSRTAHRNNNPDAPTIFTVDFINKFCADTASSFAKWIKG